MQPSDRFIGQIKDFSNGFRLFKACDPDPQNRYSSYSEFLPDLQQPGSTAQRVERRQPLLKRYPQQVWKVVSVVLLVVVVIQAWWIIQE